jgi:hypothetical protein
MTTVEGVKFAMVGVPELVPTVKLLLLFAVPAGAVTETVPEVAPAGTLVVSSVAVDVRTVAGVPLNLTVF